MRELDQQAVETIVRAALDEDLGGRGDLTSDAVIPVDREGVGNFVARTDLVLAGLSVARTVFTTLDPALVFASTHKDGMQIQRGTVLATISGRAHPILKGERTALNFLMRMSGIATAAAAAVDEIAGTGAKILDTRKTAPGLRLLDKYAVAAGGAMNHRMGLYDEAMIKDTHLEAVMSITSAVAEILARKCPAEKITVEVRDISQLREAIAAGAGRALLDNMGLDELREAVMVADGRIVLEASGGLKPGSLRAVAQTGVNYLSLGYLTHSAAAADLAMEMEVRPESRQQNTVH